VKLDLANGWTLSVVPDLDDVYWSAAAWPTDDPEVAQWEDRRWFVFPLGGIECRIANIDALIEIAELVAKAERPT